MKNTLMFVIVLALVLSAATISVAQVPYVGVVTIDSAKAHPAEMVSVKVWLRNNTIDISAMTLPLKFSHQDNNSPKRYGISSAVGIVCGWCCG
ncbi:MAG: hypothetical protein J7J98_04280 [candidate division Zixibacteria bacterium]|nr:hypothetical protein [candidate division Zixibacteria bacterium]